MIKQQLSQKLLQKLSPQQIQFIKLLQLNTLNFEERVEEELLENPALENEKDEGDDLEFQQDDFDESNFKDKDDDFDISDYMNEAEDGLKMSSDYKTNDDDRDEMPVVYFSSFRERLLEQMTSGLASEEFEVLAEQLVGTLDDDGYLRRPLSAIKNDLLFTQNIKTTEEALEKILKLIQSMDPPGIGARDLKECLLLQIQRKQEISNNPIYKLAYEIIDKHMEDFSKKHYEKLTKKLDVSEEYLKETLIFIAKLNPKPAQSGSEGAGNKDFIIPDFIVKDNYGTLEVSLNSKNAPELRVSPAYRETLQSFEASKE